MTFQKPRTPAGATKKGAETRAQILDVAARLFADHGFEATTFAMISNASGAAVGSIVHCFSDKAGLAEILYLSAMDRLVSAITRAVNRQPTDVPGTINAVIAACFSWATSHPHDPTLLRALHEHAVQGEEFGERAHIAPLIAEWAQPLIRAGLLRPLAPAQLYSVIIAPAMYGAVASSSHLDGDKQLEIEWGSVLSAAALAAIQPAATKSRPVKLPHGNAGATPAAPGVPAPSKQGSLL